MKERDPGLPQDLRAMAQAMRHAYSTAEHWWSEYPGVALARPRIVSAQASATRHEAPRRSARDRAPGPVTRVITTLVLALLCSIVLEWIGMTLVWREEGPRHSERLLVSELGALDERADESAGLVAPAALVPRVLGSLRERVDTVAVKLCAPRPCAVWLGGAADYVAAAFNVTQVFVLRSIVWLCATPLFALFGCVGVAEGLMRRDLRRWGGGRESAFLYHHGKRWLGRVLPLCLGPLPRGSRSGGAGSVVCCRPRRVSRSRSRS